MNNIHILYVMDVQHNCSSEPSIMICVKEPHEHERIREKKMDLQTARCERVKAFMCWKSWEREKYGLRETHEIAFMRQSHHFKALDATEKFQCSFEQMALMNKNLLRTKAQIMLPTINALSLSLSLCLSRIRFCPFNGSWNACIKRIYRVCGAMLNVARIECVE